MFDSKEILYEKNKTSKLDLLCRIKASGHEFY